MRSTVRLQHFLRGEVEVQPVIVDGRREWVCPDRPMMRPWPPCYFTGDQDEIEARWLAAYNDQFPSFQRGRLEDADRSAPSPL